MNYLMTSTWFAIMSITVGVFLFEMFLTLNDIFRLPSKIIIPAESQMTRMNR
jgi:hypothetical protein